MSKNLNTILGFAKVIHIVTKVLFIVSIVGGALSIVGAATSWINIPAISIDGHEIHFNLFNPDGLPTKEIVAEYIIDAINCASEAVLLGFTSTYFKNMITDNTPFTQRGAKELLRLGIVSVAVPIACMLATEFTTELLIEPVEASLTIGDATTVIGVLLIFLSFVVKYGAELEEKKKQE